MQTENLNLKKSLVMQSFAPLFLLLTIKHLDFKLYWNLVCKFISTFVKRGTVAFSIALNHSSFGGFVVSFMGIFWLLLTIAIALGFNGMQKAGFKAVGEKIIIEEEPNDSSATFLVTYVLPLLTDDVESVRGLIVFLTILIMVIMLLTSSNTFYQNPVLAAMKYRTFSFKFLNPANDIAHSDRVYIGITHGVPIVEDTVIKRKYISDGVFVIYND
ncbi:MAG: hypothetical protein LKJ13_01850 [Clostridia bacterium]|nr:hypothetical protein [Clostridia bacterium]MCI1999022.1 hypothetical protein [Clostridia bacterium]MCI2013772.1 hypothetical protein [Clostridia bacterium]